MRAESEGARAAEGAAAREKLSRVRGEAAAANRKLEEQLAEARRAAERERWLRGASRTAFCLPRAAGEGRAREEARKERRRGPWRGGGGAAQAEGWGRDDRERGRWGGCGGARRESGPVGAALSSPRLRLFACSPRWRHKEALAGLSLRLGGAASRLEALESLLGTHLPGLVSSLDRLAGVAGGGAGAWEEELGGCAAGLERLGEQVALLGESMLRQLTAFEAHGAADRGELARRVLGLEDELSVEQAAHRCTRMVSRAVRPSSRLCLRVPGGPGGRGLMTETKERGAEDVRLEEEAGEAAAGGRHRRCDRPVVTSLQALEELREESARQTAQIRESAARELEGQREGLVAKLARVEEEMERLKQAMEADRLSMEAEARQEVAGPSPGPNAGDGPTPSSVRRFPLACLPVPASLPQGLPPSLRPSAPSSFLCPSSRFPLPEIS